MSNTTHIGSLPFDNIETAIKFNREFSLPVLSTLPNLNANEYILDQILPGLPKAIIKNYKIELPARLELKQFSFEFCIKDQFIKSFKNRRVKWQIVGIATIIKSISRPLEASEIDKLIQWHATNIINFHTELSRYFSEVLLFLDEPYLNDLQDKEYIKRLLSLLSSTDIEVGIHCCGRAEARLILKLGIKHYSFDISQLNKHEFLKLQKSIDTLYIGMIDTKTLRKVNAFGFENTKSFYYTPSCGLAFSDMNGVQSIPKALGHGPN